MDSGRTEAFSDGVFAVAITLLVLNLHPPEGDSLQAGLSHSWPAYLAYVVSFLTIGIMWMNHHSLFRHIVRVDRPLMLLNLLLLMVVVLVPFPTDLLGRQLGHELHSHDAKTATVVFGLVMMLMGLCFSAIWWYAVLRGDILNQRLSRAAIRNSTWRFTVGGFAYPLTALVAMWQPIVALVLYGVLSVYYLFEHLPSPDVQSV